MNVVVAAGFVYVLVGLYALTTVARWFGLERWLP